MTRSDELEPDRLDELLLDERMGALSAADAEALRAAEAGDPRTLAERRRALSVLLEAEREAFAPETRPDWNAEAQAARVAAWVQDRTRSAEASRRSAVRARAATPRTRWARILAFSVGLHVLLLGVVAMMLRHDAAEERSPGAFIALEEDFADLEPDPDPIDTELARVYPSLTWEGPTQVPDELVLREQETYAVSDPLPTDMEPTPGAARAAGGLFDQPLGVVVAASRRRNPALKRRRLDLLGFNAAGTLRAVEKGLNYLAPRQNEDGSFPGASGSNTPDANPRENPAGARTEVEQTAIVLLAFLADGHCSRAPADAGHGPVVARGVRWLRDQLFNASRNDAERAAHLEAFDASVLGPATVALCEDYMLSYGWLSPAAAETRAREIAELAGRLQSPAGTRSSTDAVEQPWSVWGLDAAARVGVVGSTATDMQAFRRWVQEAASAPTTVSAMSFLSVGTALLFAERGAEKPRFLEWSRANAPLLAARLGPHGYVRAGDTVGETALVLLGLQVTYRTY